MEGSDPANLFSRSGGKKNVIVPQLSSATAHLAAVASQAPDLLFSEANGPWQPIPHWAKFLIGFGFGWPSETVGVRRIALISMPCDSGSAGLIVLGAMIRDLGRAGTNEVDGHYDGLLRYAHQYLSTCRPCPLKTCNPVEQRCGCVSEATGILRSTSIPNKKFTISDRTSFEERRLAVHFSDGRNKTCVHLLNPGHTVVYYIDGEPPHQDSSPRSALTAEVYDRLVDGAEIMPENLRASYSGLCFAGRAAGSSATQQICSLLRFRHGTAVLQLDELITVHAWSPGTISRVSFFNAHTSRLDRHSAVPALVVADGDAAFHKCLATPGFQEADIAAVVHRTMEHEKLEAVGNKIDELRQWYEPDEEFLTRLPSLPRGLSLTVLKRRKS